METIDSLSFTSDKKLIIFVGIGALCAGILIGFKLAGGQKGRTYRKPTGSIIHRTNTGITGNRGRK